MSQARLAREATEGHLQTTRGSLALSMCLLFFFFSSRRRHTRLQGDWSSDVCSSDLFSERHYSLDDSPRGEPDPTLAHFSMEPQAHDLFPLLHEIRAINPRLRVVASPWSAPAWMKDSGKLVRGRLRADAYDAFGQYLLRVADAYAAAGLPLYAITVQNEPGFEPGNYPGMPFKAAARAEFIGRHLGPLFARRPDAPLILEWDHNWIAPGSPLRVLGDPAAARYIAGVAWHC